MKPKGLLGQIHRALIKEGELPSSNLAKRFLMMDTPAAATMVNTLLKDNSLFEKSGDLWKGINVSENRLDKLDLTFCYLTLASDNRTVLSLSIFKLVNSELKPLLTISNTQNSSDFTESKADESFSFDAGILESYRHLARGRVLFFSHLHQRIMMSLLQNRGLTLSEESFPISQLFKMAKLKKVSLDVGVNKIANSLVEVEKEPIDSYESCKLLGEVTKVLLNKIAETGIKSTDEFENSEKSEVYSARWAKAKFDVNTVLGFEETPGVYGFKDKNGEMIYVGKAKSLRRRVLTYFRNSDESPAKLTQLRAEAVEIITHPCGSELEALITENRLIKKYDPKLNSQLNHFDRVGEYKSIPLSIFILPAANENDVTLLFYNSLPDITLKTVSRDEIDSAFSTDVIKENFFSEVSDDSNLTDEKRIAERWILPRLGELTRIDATSCESETDMVEKLEDAVKFSEDSGVIFR